MSNRVLHRDRNLSAPLNWRRGMFRLWVLVSTAWILGWVIYFLIEFIGGETAVRDLPAAAVTLLGPPLALALMGIATRWAFLGFKTEDRLKTEERLPGA